MIHKIILFLFLPIFAQMWPNPGPGHASSGGGGSTWHDVVALGSQTGQNDDLIGVIIANKITLPAISVTDFRVGVVSYFGANSIKMALYDSSKNLVAGTAVTISPAASDNTYTSASITPVSISAGDYWIAFAMQTSHQTAIGLSSSTNELISFSYGYADFPRASLSDFSTSYTLKFTTSVNGTP